MVHHGLPDYNTVRKAYGLPPVTAFDQITSNQELQSELQTLYGDVDHADVLIGGLAEDHVEGSAVGPTFQAILVNQFVRTRAGDRLWFEATFSGSELDALEHTTLSDIIKWNTTLTNIQDNVFFFQADTIGGHAFLDLDQDGMREPGDPGLDGIPIELRNTLGMLLQTALTADDGSYSFTDLREGTKYIVDVVWPPSLKPTSPTALTVQLADAKGAGEFLTDFGAYPA
jgi:hypothetical protein